MWSVMPEYKEDRTRHNLEPPRKQSFLAMESKVPLHHVSVHNATTRKTTSEFCGRCLECCDSAQASPNQFTPVTIASSMT